MVFRGKLLSIRDGASKAAADDVRASRVAQMRARCPRQALRCFIFILSKFFTTFEMQRPTKDATGFDRVARTPIPEIMAGAF
ncbi:MAG: hypothetical protein ACJASS_002033 [Sulfitobacter sp.]